jgi:xanthine dehydrogenase accessory factor
MTDSHETMRDQGFVARLVAEVEAGRGVALCSVLATRGSMPRPAGARMALLSDGTALGTIGGGRIEWLVQGRAARMLARDDLPDELAWYTHERTGMACGGDALVSVMRLRAAHAALLRGLLATLEAGATAWLVERWSEGVPRLELVPYGSLRTDEADLCSDVVCWSEERRTFVEPVGPDPAAYLFGGGYVGAALVPVLASVGFRVIVVDDRVDVALSERFPAAERVVLADFARLGEVGVDVTPRDYAVVLTHGHAADIDVLEQVVPVPPAYVGCIGSRGKAVFAREQLRLRGVDPELVDAIHLPIGERILAVTPAEIAVSIAAEMIRCRAERRPERPHSSPAAEGTVGRPS